MSHRLQPGRVIIAEFDPVLIGFSDTIGGVEEVARHHCPLAATPPGDRNTGWVVV